MKKDLAVIFGLLGLVVFLLVFMRGFTSAVFLKPRESTKSASVKSGFTQVSVKGLVVNAKIAAKASDRKDGLSGRETLPLSEGMLFVFEESGIYPFWMKDMKFAIDIIWIDENKRIVYIAHNASPEPKKGDKDLTLYRPGSDAKYVLEVNAGLSALNALSFGDVVNFEL